MTEEELTQYWHLRDMALLYFQSMALHKACEVDLFTALEPAARTPQEVAAHLGLNADAVSRLLEALAAMGLLEVRDGRYANGEVARRFLVEGAPLSQVDMIRHSRVSPEYVQQYDEIFRVGTLHAPHPGPAHAAELVSAMDESARVAAPLLVDRLELGQGERVLDLGGGAGTYSVLLARTRPDLSAVVVDLPPIADAARPLVDASDVGARVALRGADFTAEPLGDGYTLVLLVTVIHYLDRATLAATVKRAADALRPGGRLVVSDMLLAGRGDGPLREALYSIRLLITTDGGMAHSQPEVEDAMRSAGLEVVKSERLLPSLSSYVIGRKPLSAPR